jgi:hypothetical protein
LAKLGEISKSPTPAALLSAAAVKELSTRRDDSGQIILGENGQPVTNILGSVVGHSRGTSTVVSQNYTLQYDGFYNQNLHIFENNPAAFQSGIVESGSGITRSENIHIWAPPTDPIAHYVGFYHGEFSWKAITEMMDTPYSVHSCPGAGAIGCENINVPKGGEYFDYSNFNRAVNIRDYLEGNKDKY